MKKQWFKKSQDDLNRNLLRLPLIRCAIGAIAAIESVYDEKSDSI